MNEEYFPNNVKTLSKYCLNNTGILSKYYTHIACSNKFYIVKVFSIYFPNILQKWSKKHLNIHSYRTKIVQYCPNIVQIR